jgi:osmotically-inducible protein OsmY
LALTAVFTLSAFGHTSAINSATNNKAPTNTTRTQTTKPAKSTPAPKSDSEIQSCIESKLASSSKLKDQSFSVSVNNGVATFTGTAKNSGSKSGVSSLAKSCGSKQVVNNITVEKAGKTTQSSASSSSGQTKHATKPKY